MVTALAHLGLEVKSLDRARTFYVDRLGLSPVRETDTELAFAVGDAELVLRRPRAVPRGGLHTHYAFAAPPEEYDAWRERVADLDPAEHQFGSYRSLYVDDPDDHCVEIGSNGAGEGLTAVFEIVLEVAALEPARERYRSLGFEVVDEGSARRRTRLRGGEGSIPLDLELWEPQLGLADARGGVHVDLGLRVADPASAADSIREDVCERTALDSGVRVREADGHWLTFRGV